MIYSVLGIRVTGLLLWIDRFNLCHPLLPAQLSLMIPAEQLTCLLFWGAKCLLSECEILAWGSNFKVFVTLYTNLALEKLSKTSLKIKGHFVKMQNEFKIFPIAFFIRKIFRLNPIGIIMSGITSRRSKLKITLSLQMWCID